METLMMRGKAVADAYREKIAAKIAVAKGQGKEVSLSVVLVGDDPASGVYTGRLVKMAESLGVNAKTIVLPAESTQEQVIAEITKLNMDESITGILPMMPMPKHINGDAIGAALAPNKDVDCLNPLNAGDLYMGRTAWAPCTPRACMATLKHYNIELSGKNVVVVGRSNVVGKPVALLLLQENATVTICHSRTVDIASHLQKADIIVAAVGIPEFVKPEMVKDGVVIVDVGINSVGDKLVGDVADTIA